MSEEKAYKHDLKVINIGLQSFYDAIARQDVKVAQLDWRPPYKQSQEFAEMLDMFL